MTKAHTLFLKYTGTSDVRTLTSADFPETGWDEEWTVSFAATNGFVVETTPNIAEAIFAKCPKEIRAADEDEIRQAAIAVESSVDAMMSDAQTLPAKLGDS